MVMVAGLVALVVSLFVPTLEHRAGCSDHCAEATTYYVWDQTHAFFSVFVLVGVVFLVTSRRGFPKTRTARWVAALCGWFGVALTLTLPPLIVEEGALYGSGVDWEARWGGDVFALGYLLVFLGSLPLLVRRGSAREREAVA